MVIVTLGATRTGLMARWTMYLGIFAALLAFTPFGLALGEVQQLIPAFWMVTTGILLMGRWPGGDPAGVGRRRSAAVALVGRSPRAARRGRDARRRDGRSRTGGTGAGGDVAPAPLQPAAAELEAPAQARRAAVAEPTAPLAGESVRLAASQRRRSAARPVIGAAMIEFRPERE